MLHFKGYLLIFLIFLVIVRQVFEEAITHFNNKTCIRFKPRSSETNYIRIIDGDGYFLQCNTYNSVKQIHIIHIIYIFFTFYIF